MEAKLFTISRMRELKLLMYVVLLKLLFIIGSKVLI